MWVSDPSQVLFTQRNLELISSQLATSFGQQSCLVFVCDRPSSVEEEHC